MRLLRLLAAMTACLLVLTTTTTVAGTAAAERAKPRDVSKKELRNAPIKGVCGGWKGRFKKGKLRDSRNYEGIAVGRVLVGKLDRKRGKDGLSEIVCGTRTPRPTYLAVYTADGRGKPRLRSTFSMGRLAADKLFSADVHLDSWSLSGSTLTLSWHDHEQSWTEYAAPLPSTAVAQIVRGKIRLASVRRDGAREISARFGEAMARGDWAAARSLSSDEVVTSLQGYSPEAFAGPVTCYEGEVEHSSVATAYCNLARLQLHVAYNEDAGRWIVTYGGEAGW